MSCADKSPSFIHNNSYLNEKKNACLHYLLTINIISQPYTYCTKQIPNKFLFYLLLLLLLYFLLDSFSFFKL